MKKIGGKKSRATVPLKGLFGENKQGSKMVPIDRFSFQDVLLELLFNYFSAPEYSRA